MSQQPLRIALLSYRGNPHSGGQGIYVRYLSKALVDLGHHVEVFAGQPYPELHDDVALTKCPSLGLYNDEHPFRTPARSEFRDAIDLLEYGLMALSSYPEPITFSMRIARHLKHRTDDFDVVHDNQCLGYGLLDLQTHFPVVATIHHPCSIDREVETAAAHDPPTRESLKWWYGFTAMQAWVARRLSRIVTVSGSARDDVVREFEVPSEKIAVVHNGVDGDLFRPLPNIARIPGRLIATISNESPVKGLIHLIEAMAKVRTERDVSLVVIGKRREGSPVADAVQRFGLEASIQFKQGLDYHELVEEHARAQVAVVPSLYEGFSLPAIEAMSCGLPLIATTAGALPEVVGSDGECAVHVRPGDAGELAVAIGKVLEDERLRVTLGVNGRRRARRKFRWRAAAQLTVEQYESARKDRGRLAERPPVGAPEVTKR